MLSMSEFRRMLRRREDTVSFAESSISDLEWVQQEFYLRPVEVDGDALAILRKVVTS